MSEAVSTPPPTLTAERAAQEILSSLWLDDADEPRLPVDPFFIAETMGIQVYAVGLAAGVSGMLRKRSGEDAEIYLQRSDSRNRQRFTCAHELGHYVWRTAKGDEEWEYVEHRALLASQGSDPDEIYANRFAASLLMPREAVKTFEEQLTTPAALAVKFGVSTDAMNYRLVYLGLT
jgi:Zn-dependent peptidase ImmA (M78 family)